MSQKQSVDRKADVTQCKQSLNGVEVGVDDYVVMGDAKELTRNGQATTTEANRGHS